MFMLMWLWRRRPNTIGGIGAERVVPTNTLQALFAGFVWFEAGATGGGGGGGGARVQMRIVTATVVRLI